MVGKLCYDYLLLHLMKSMKTAVVGTALNTIGQV
jgi:hypothetical protein